MHETDNHKVFRSTALVRFAMGDQAGVLFFASIFPLAHAVLEDFISASDIGWQEWFKSSTFGVPFRRAEAEYLCPMRPGEEVATALRITKLGNSSVSFAIEFSHPDQLAAVVKFTCVFVERPGRTKIAIPPAIREKLAPYLA